MNGSLLKYVNKVDATSDNDTSINFFVSSTSPGIVIPEPEPMLTDTVEQCGCAMSFTSEPVIQADAEPTVADLGLGIRSSKESISNDPAEWGINADLIAYYSENIPLQNLKSDLSLKGRQFGKKIRYIFGCKTGSAGTNNAPRNQFITGFDNWKNVIARITSHEKSKDHFAAVSMIMQYKKSTRIDVELQKENEKSSKYWTEVLKRFVVVIKFLAERGLAFRGDNQLHNSPNNGNYLGCIDLLAEFDPFLREHIQRYGNPGKGNVSYLSANICDEFIDILGGKVLKQIISEIKDAKYYGISIDSTPDISHVDQLTLVIRYQLKNKNVVERFLQFIPIENHDGEYVFNLVVGILQFHGIDIKNCRSQSYDNANNISGIYSGVQARFREINHLAECVSSAAHSLNLVGSAAVECCSAAVNYFGVIQSVYNFFSASTKRWSTLKELFKINVFVLQSLSETRWSSRSDATRAFYANYLQIRQALCEVTNSKHQPSAAVHEAKSLVKHLDYFETALMCVIWIDLLQKMNIVNKALQEPGIELCTIIKLYDVLIQYFHDTRSKFETFEGQAKDLTESDYKEATQRKRIRKRFDDEVMDTSNPSLNVSARDNFRIQQYYVIIDRLNNEMEKRRAAYKVL
ncbi:zinc finger MYM-type protein 1-like [Hydra vulgaris]|uniref:Zinc finger MYM-type protein 1-like n=1 Tax=Hydra vulgaris TaxID=6087 RepID=A0ABM4BND7_HYDVU